MGEGVSCGPGSWERQVPKVQPWEQRRGGTRLNTLLLDVWSRLGAGSLVVILGDSTRSPPQGGWALEALPQASGGLCSSPGMAAPGSGARPWWCPSV